MIHKETKEKPAKEYLQDCFMQKCSDELDAYYENSDIALDKYSQFAIKFMPIISLGLSSSIVLITSSLNFNLAMSIIALSVILFFIATMLITRYYIKHKQNKEILLDIYDAWNKSLILAIIINVGLYLFTTLASSILLVILTFATIAMIVIQNGRKKLITL